MSTRVTFGINIIFEKCALKGLPLLSSEASYTWIAINPQFKPRGFINFMVYIHPGSNRD